MTSCAIASWGVRRSSRFVLQAATSHEGFKTAIKIKPLAEISRAWETSGAESRVVFVP
jgi:hypothetical protein